MSTYYQSTFTSHLLSFISTLIRQLPAIGPPFTFILAALIFDFGFYKRHLDEQTFLSHVLSS